MLCIDLKGIEASASALIKLTEKFNELQSVSMYIRAESVDTDIHRMTDNENDDDKSNDRYEDEYSDTDKESDYSVIEITADLRPL